MMSKENIHNLLQILLKKQPKTHNKLNKVKRKFARDNKISTMITNAELLDIYRKMVAKD